MNYFRITEFQQRKFVSSECELRADILNSQNPPQKQQKWVEVCELALGCNPILL